MTLIDITRPLYTGLPVWPGDTPAKFTFAHTKAAGHAANVGRWRLSAHTGTHADAPFHYNDAGAKLDELDPGLFVGLGTGRSSGSAFPRSSATSRDEPLAGRG